MNIKADQTLVIRKLTQQIGELSLLLAMFQVQVETLQNQVEMLQNELESLTKKKRKKGDKQGTMPNAKKDE